jgi:polysaccharide deacetylase 2 family uncharacterized protein YibQ
MSKRKRSTKYKKNTLYIVNVFISACLVIALGFLTALFLQNQQLKEEQELRQNTIKKQQLLEAIEKDKKLAQQAKEFEEKTKAMTVIEYPINETLVEDISQKAKTIKEDKQIIFKYLDDNESITNSIDIVDNNLEKKRSKVTTSKQLPKVAIIIDDVISSTQVKRVKAIPYPVTMSFLPPTSRHKNSAKISQEIPFYMIHLPLEARSRKYEESNTLYIEDSINTIDKRIQQLKKLYPKAKYINNHTGSKFTKNGQAMDKLMKVLKKYGYIFIDSKTAPYTKTKKYATKYKVKFFNRDIFLDNKKDKKHIQNQLRKAINIAKRRGFSVAIGHPHKITLKTLAQSKHLLDGVEAVFINKL